MIPYFTGAKVRKYIKLAKGFQAFFVVISSVIDFFFVILQPVNVINRFIDHLWQGCSNEGLAATDGQEDSPQVMY
jgi:hypothetical protein